MDKPINVYGIARNAEETGLIVRPLVCETCSEPKTLVRHHRDYNEPIKITWLCHSCHRAEHCQNKELRNPYHNTGERKPVQLDTRTHSIIRKEAIRQSVRPGFTVTMGGVIAQLAIQLTKRQRRK